MKIELEFWKQNLQKIIERVRAHERKCTSFGDSGETGESGDSSECGFSGEFDKSGESDNLVILVNVMYLVNLVILVILPTGIYVIWWVSVRPLGVGLENVLFCNDDIIVPL